MRTRRKNDSAMSGWLRRFQISVASSISSATSCSPRLVRAAASSTLPSSAHSCWRDSTSRTAAQRARLDRVRLQRLAEVRVGVDRAVHLLAQLAGRDLGQRALVAVGGALGALPT